MIEKLEQCPCCPATKCKMDEPCLGCETYGEWLNTRPSPQSEDGLKIPCDKCGKILKQPGALLFHPPVDGLCKKEHICKECFQCEDGVVDNGIKNLEIFNEWFRKQKYRSDLRQAIPIIMRDFFRTHLKPLGKEEKGGIDKDILLKLLHEYGWHISDGVDCCSGHDEEYEVESLEEITTKVKPQRRAGSVSEIAQAIGDTKYRDGNVDTHLADQEIIWNIAEAIHRLITGEKE